MKYLIDAYGAMLLKAVAVHLGYVLVSVAIGFALGLVLGVLLSRVPRWSGIVLPILSPWWLTEIKSQEISFATLLTNVVP